MRIIVYLIYYTYTYIVNADNERRTMIGREITQRGLIFWCVIGILPLLNLATMIHLAFTI